MAETATISTKGMSLNNMKLVMQRIQQDYPNRQEVTQQIADSGGSISYATDEEVQEMLDEVFGASQTTEQTGS